MCFARKVAAELWQESWIRGVPETETFFCDACQEERPAHGSNRYDAILLCNTCVGNVEALMAKGDVTSVAAWTAEVAQFNQLRLTVRKAEKEGQGILLLPDGRWLEFFPLYLYIRNSPYKDSDCEDDNSWPYPDVRPTMYQGYVRSDWQPGQYFNAPDEEIIFTSSNRLLDFLKTGTLPKSASRNPRRRREG